MNAATHSRSLPGNTIAGKPTRLWTCVGECAWIVLSTLAAVVLLALFVLATETGTGISLAESMARPINLLRLGLMGGAFALWSYILRSGREPDS